MSVAQNIRLVALLALLFTPTLLSATPAGLVSSGKKVLKKPPRTSIPHYVRMLDDPAVTLSKLNRSSLMSSQPRKNIDKLLTKGVREGRLTEIESQVLLAKYAKVEGRGDFVLLECLQVRTCSLGEFPESDVVKQVGGNQLHLYHAARCQNCNKENIYKKSGDTTEAVMDSFYQRSGWERLEGEIGNSGIDGLYIKRSDSGLVKDVLVAEAKYNTSPLAETNVGTQMSKSWVRANLSRLYDRAESDGRTDDSKLYFQVQQYIEADIYRAQSWRMNVDEDKIVITRQVIKSKDTVITTSPYVDSSVWTEGGKGQHVVNLNAPGSSFDEELASDYMESLTK